MTRRRALVVALLVLVAAAAWILHGVKPWRSAVTAPSVGEPPRGGDETIRRPDAGRPGASPVEEGRTRP